VRCLLADRPGSAHPGSPLVVGRAAFLSDEGNCLVACDATSSFAAALRSPGVGWKSGPQRAGRASGRLSLLADRRG